MDFSAGKTSAVPPVTIKEPAKKQEWTPGEGRSAAEREKDNLLARRKEEGEEETEEEKFLKMSETERRKSLRSNEDEAAYQAFLRSSGGGRSSFGT